MQDPRADSLQLFNHAVRAAWGPLTTELVADARRAAARLLDGDPTEPWRASLRLDGPASRELLRDPTLGFVLLAHTEHADLYRPPHDHGRGWVIYAVIAGEMQMRTYRRIHDLRGDARLVEREAFALRAGDIRVFLPGDIHDTRCTAGPLTLLRFTSRDLRSEEVTRYHAPGAVRTSAS